MTDAADTPLPKTIGRLKNLPIRSVWPREDKDFTPWLALPDNLSLLSEILELGPLAVEGTEVCVGDFFIDILAKDQTGGIVIIENQFGKTDHTHLGQILTYVAGQEGSVTVVWVAEKFREEHRAAVDWLNANTLDRSNFFAAELEALAIGESPPAPWLNVVAKPNGWSRGVKRATQTASDTPTTEAQVFNIGYWEAFAAFLDERKASFRFKLPNKQRYAYFSLQPYVLYMNAWARADIPVGSKTGLQVDIWIASNYAKPIFQRLVQERTDLEAAFGESLIWEERPNDKGSRIAITNMTFACTDTASWPQQFDWMLARLTKFRNIFLDRIKAMEAEFSA